MTPVQRRWIGLLLAVLLLGGCGRKEVPQVISGAAPPELLGLKHEVQGATLTLTFRLQGDPAGLGYQIDRTEIDPYCQCPGFWRRDFEQPPRPGLGGKKLTRAIALKTDKKEFVFRVRAYDEAGRLGPWSKSIRVRAVDLFK
jgi:hypothetical protein